MKCTMTRGLRHEGLILAAALALTLGLAPRAASAALRCEGRTLFWGERPIHLVGYSYYGLIADREFDRDAFLETLAAHNVNFTRFFLIVPWPVETGPNLLPFAKTGEKYDLRQLNGAFFVRLRSIVKRAEELGIVCQVCLFDRCGLSADDRQAWPNNPYNADCNVNGFLKSAAGGYPPFCHSEGPIAEINAAVIRKVVDTLGDCDNVIYEIINEPYPQLGPLPQWHAWVARELRKSLEHCSGSKVISSTGPYDDPEIDVFSMHMGGSPPHVEAAIGQSKTLRKPVILSDDGDMRCMFNPDVTRVASERALRLGQHFEHLEYTVTLQREEAKRPAARLDEMPALAQLNLRNLAQYSTPLLERPYVRSGTIRMTAGGCVYSARIENADRVRRVIGQRSADGGRAWSEVPVVTDLPTVRIERLPVRAEARDLVRVVCVDGQSRRWPGPVGCCGPTKAWTVRLDTGIREVGLVCVRPYWPDGVLRPARRGGQPCYETDLEHRGKYAYFRLEDSFPRGSDPQAVSITVELFDQPAGAQLRLEYDGASGPYTSAPPIALTGSRTWKRVAFAVGEATFRGRQNDGADFRLSIQDPLAPLALRSVRVEVGPSPQH